MAQPRPNGGILLVWLLLRATFQMCVNSRFSTRICFCQSRCFPSPSPTHSSSFCVCLAAASSQGHRGISTLPPNAQAHSYALKSTKGVRGGCGAVVLRVANHYYHIPQVPSGTESGSDRGWPRC